MKKIFLPLFIAVSMVGLHGADVPWVHDTFANGDFKLAQGTQLADVYYAPEDAKAVQIAANLFAEDVERVTGHKPLVKTDATKLTGQAVIAGTFGKSSLIDKLVADGKLDAKPITGQWESFIITTVANPLPGVSSALVIVGSDRRGTAYGVFEVSKGIGVSPWYWWADVTPEHHDDLFVAAGLKKFGPPSVKFRGIFINDEDWGLNPWASKTFEPDASGSAPKFAPLVHPPASAAEAAAEAKIASIGPKTYAKVFELLLRLKANTLWPAMHEVSTPFNLVPGNAQTADDYGIVMGASHAEPMLRDNVNEWPHDDQPAYNFVSNPEGVTKYWEERLQTNGKFESIYTIGMRGIHDSAIQLPRGADPVAALESIFSVQRGLLAKYVNPDPAQVPQIFCPYKEVLAQFLGNLHVPPDVTVVFPDDNFGYLRYLPTPEQVAARPGGFGIYYHISYLGSPYSYVWLNTTPPALIWEEMSKAYDHGIRNLWILNVGDIKPGEIGMDFFMQMAWDEKKWNIGNLNDYLKSFAAEQFGAEQAPKIALLLEEYFHFNYQRKPEHLQWNIRGEPAGPSTLANNDYGDEVSSRLTVLSGLRALAEQVSKSLEPRQRDGFFELVQYPLEASALANERVFAGEQAEFDLTRGMAAAVPLKASIATAENQLTVDTARYNDEIMNGKWKNIMPNDAMQRDRSYRTAAWKAPTILDTFQPAATAGFGVLVEGQADPMTKDAPAALPLFDPFVAKEHFLTVYDTGMAHTEWSAMSGADWIKLDTHPRFAANGNGPHLERIWVSIDWAKVPKGADVSGNIVVTDGKNTYTVKVPVYNPAEVRPEQLKGWFVESNGVVSMEAQNFSKKSDKSGAAWHAVPGLGRTGDAVGVFPTTAPSVEADKAVTDAPALEYDFYMFSKGDVTIHYNLIPTQPIKYGQGLRFAVSVDDGPVTPVVIKSGTAGEVASSPAWQHAVLDNTTSTTTQHTLAAAGAHKLKIYMTDPGVLLEKIVVDAGGLRPSYLGPPETRVVAK